MAIKDASEQTLKSSVELLAKLLGAEVVDRVRTLDYRAQTVDVPCGIKMRGLENGIGFRVKDGQLLSDGDPYGQEEEYARVEALLKQTYGYVDSCNKLRTKGFTIDSKIKVFGNKIDATVVGMKYA